MAQLARRFQRVAPFLIVGLIWEAAGRIANSFLFPPISRIIMTYPQLIQSGELGAALLISGRAFLLGMALSVVVGIVMGLLMGRYDTLNDVILPYVNALYSMPRAALTPLILIWFGVGFVGRVFLITLGGTLPIILNTAAGVRNVDKSLIEVGRSFRASESQMFREIILPGALPFVAAGIRIGFGRALVGTVVAEFFLEITGLGGLIITYGDAFVYPKMMAVILVLSAFGVVFSGFLKYVESAIAPWSRAESSQD